MGDRNETAKGWTAPRLALGSTPAAALLKYSAPPPLAAVGVPSPPPVPASPPTAPLMPHSGGGTYSVGASDARSWAYRLGARASVGEYARCCDELPALDMDILAAAREGRTGKSSERRCGEEDTSWVDQGGECEYGCRWWWWCPCTSDSAWASSTLVRGELGVVLCWMTVAEERDRARCGAAWSLSGSGVGVDGVEVSAGKKTTSVIPEETKQPIPPSMSIKSVMNLYKRVH